MYPGFARVGALIGALALFAGMSICTNTTPPRKAHSAARPAPEESPESRRLFGAVWGAQPQRSPCGIIANHKFIAKGTLHENGVPFRIADSGRNPVEIAIKKQPNPK